MPDSSLDAAQKIAEPRDVEQPCCRVGPGGLEEDVARVVPAQDVVDEVRGHRDLAPRLLASGFPVPYVAALHEPGDDGDLAEGAFHQVRFGEPSVEIIAQHILGKEPGKVEPAARDHLRNVAQPPHGHAVVVGDEAQRLRAGAVEASRQQHAERLVGETSFEGIGDKIVAAAARKGLDQHFLARRDHRPVPLQLQPLADRGREPRPGTDIGQHRAHALGKMRGQGKLAAVVAGDDRIAGGGPRHEGFRFTQAFKAYDLAREHEGVAGTQLLDEVLVDLAEDAPPAIALRVLVRERPSSRTLIKGAATIVPAFSR